MAVLFGRISISYTMLADGVFCLERDLDACIEQLKQGNCLAEHVCKFVCQSLTAVFLKESNVCHVVAPVTVVGDIHGQYFDLLELFAIGGDCPLTNYLFLGDYVDRGPFSVEVMSLLCCLKLRHPERITLLRGNHESRQTTQVYGFYADCMKKYGSAHVWEHFTRLFDAMPISALIDDRIFCIHAGLSPSLHSIDQVRALNRVQEIPHEGGMADLMWSDPDADHSGFRLSTRGAGYTFGGDVVDKFCAWNNLDCILRAHQLCLSGYQVLFDDKMATVWSAPNYCFRVGNLASILEIDDQHGKFFNVFAAAPIQDRSSSEAQQPPRPPVEFFDD